MTDRRRRRGLVPVATSALAGFLLIAAVLAIQLRIGRDPALGAPKIASVASEPRRILVRRIEERRVIVRVISAPQPVRSAPRAAGAHTAVSVARPPAAPSIAAAPPARPPAPIVTRSS
jgi:hypothetical protein